MIVHHLVKESDITSVTASESSLAGSSSSGTTSGTTLLVLAATAAATLGGLGSLRSGSGSGRSDGDGLGGGGNESGGRDGSGSGGGRSSGSSSSNSGSGGSGGSRSGGSNGGIGKTSESGGGSGDGGAGLLDVDGALDESRAGDGVAAHGPVDVEEDAFVVRGVERGALNTGGILSAGAGDLEVEALGVVLGAVGLVGGMECDDLVAEDVEAGGDVLGNLDEPAVAVLNELVGTPLAGGGGTVDKADLVDLEELEGGLVNGLAAGGAAVGEVVDHRTVVRLGPGVPLDGNLVTGLDNGMALGVGRVAVADDIGRGESIGSDKAVVGVASCPANDNRGVGHVGEAVDLITLVRVTVDDNVGNVTVGGDGSSAGEGGKKRLGSEGRHLG